MAPEVSGHFSARCSCAPGATSTSWRAARSSRRCGRAGCASDRRSSATSKCRVSRLARAPRRADRADLVLVCVKTHQTESILDDLAAAVGDETVLIAAAERRGVRRAARRALRPPPRPPRGGLRRRHDRRTRCRQPSGAGADLDRRAARVRRTAAGGDPRDPRRHRSGGAALARHSARALAQIDVERELQHGVGRHVAHAGRAARPAGDSRAHRRRS